MSDNSILTDYLQEMMQEDIPVLTKNEEHILSALIQSGDEGALDKLIRHNLRLVVFIVTKMTAWRHSKVPVDDIIGMGNEALVLAARKWVPTNNSGFASYAGEYIKKFVTRELDNTERTIRIPIHILQSIKKMNYAERKLTQILGREPLTHELAEIIGVSDSRISQLKGYVSREPISLDGLNDGNNQEEDRDD